MQRYIHKRDERACVHISFVHGLLRETYMFVHAMCYCAYKYMFLCGDICLYYVFVYMIMCGMDVSIHMLS